ncbi:hypothetical protein Patl1_00566 [Pistacia atlantica]|uniref:Uncharacterized protein n=1 Tax=Pistacia atlantica TaxID=434234 RepID=A0ACC1CDN5_9ROSI|nr:hypothetical protein Patl1_00566 [Pistacia atlantica]
MSILKFPKHFCTKLCMSVANFWWKKSKERKGIHWVGWKKLSKSKKEGGLGFKDFYKMNQILLSKQAWRILLNPDMLWVRILKAIYFPQKTFGRQHEKRIVLGVGRVCCLAEVSQGESNLEGE